MKKLLFCLICNCISIHAAYALSLDEAIDASLHYESQLKLKQLSLNQSEAVLEQAKKSHGLNVNIQGQYDYERVNTPSGVMFPTSGNRHGRAVQLQFDYPIYTSGRHQLGVDVAESQRAAQRQSFLDSKADTIVQTVMVYTEVLKKQAILKLRENVYQNLERALYEAQKKFAAGVITRADLAQVEAQLAQGFADITQMQSELKISMTQFEQVTGIRPQQLQTVSKVPSLPITLEDMLLHVERHPALKQAILEKEAFDSQYKLTQRELKPSVLLLSRISKQNEATYIGSESDNYLVGLQVNLPLYNGGLNKANLKKASADIEVAQQRIEVIQRQLSKQLQDTHARLQSIQQNKKAIEMNIHSASMALDYIRKELEFGTKTTYDLLTAEQKLADVKTQQIVNNQDEILLTYQLLEQMGLLDTTLAKTQ
nr:TolC family protein [Acinetobacter sp. LoGeW2-3]